MNISKTFFFSPQHFPSPKREGQIEFLELLKRNLPTDEVSQFLRRLIKREYTIGRFTSVLIVCMRRRSLHAT
jgi:hypothetical protein